MKLTCLALALSLLLSSCAVTEGEDATLVEPEALPLAVEAAEAAHGQSGSIFPQSIEEIPDGYYNAAAQQGMLEDLYYDTWESFSYEQHTRALQKHAVVYLPYGYDASETYEVFYLMHGGWSNENTTLGTPANPSGFKNVLDNAIQNGEIRPLIVVCPTYNNANENGQDSDSFSLAMQLTRNYHNELVNDLLPAVEGKYSVYTDRDHRGFGGFSMGSVTTWRTFEYALDCFRYFLPMSCGTGLDDEEIWSAAEGCAQSDYFVFIMTGTSDFAYSYDSSRAERAKASPYFTEGENFAYLVKEGYSHDGLAANEYTYNGMKAFFGKEAQAVRASEPYTRSSKIMDVMNDPAFRGYGRLLFPANSGYYSGDTLENLRLTWYSNIDPGKTVEIVNTLKSRAEAGETIFYDIYTDAEKAADPAKRDTGLFFFRGEPGAKFAVCNAGGGFAYVGAMHDSFPHALELSKLGYNAFALIYRPGWDTAMEDLGRAICFIEDNADALGVYPEGYSLWGGSAGARMAATLGNANELAYYTGRSDVPQAAAVIMQYTGHTETSRADAPTYACCGTSDGIADWRTMQSRLNTLTDRYGIPTEFHAYNGLSHG
ncbi:MAG: esterase, partial [Oscillospiraceae bacterium]|nr:esterase [Oscillospiraceae bacterium]